jgi:hypothetical protein
VVILEASVGSYTGFVMVTGIVGLAFLFVHAVTNSALVRLFGSTRDYWRAVIPIVSTLTFVFIIIQETISGGMVRYSAYAVIFIVIFSVFAVATKKYLFAPSYRKMNFSDIPMEFNDEASDS